MFVSGVPAAGNRACGRCSKCCPHLSKEHQLRGSQRGVVDGAGSAAGQPWGEVLPGHMPRLPGPKPPPGWGVIVLMQVTFLKAPAWHLTRGKHSVM